MKMHSGIDSLQNQTHDPLFWVAGMLIGTAFLWPLFFAIYLWAVYANKL